MRLYKDIDSSLPANDRLSSGGTSHPLLSLPLPLSLSLFASLPALRFGIHVPTRAPERAFPVCGCVCVCVCKRIHSWSTRVYTQSTCLVRVDGTADGNATTSPSAATTTTTTTVSKSFKVSRRRGVSKNRPVGLCPASLIFSLDYILAS